MGRIPCKLCGSCGLYNDLSVRTCECGADLTKVPGMLVDDQIPPERYGEINKNLPIFVQKCSACGAENFTADPSKPTRICYNCHKARVASVVPVPYEAGKAPSPPVNEPEEQQPSQVVFRPASPPLGPGAVFPPVTEADDDDDDDDGGNVSHWQSILEGVQSSVGSAAAPSAVSPPLSPAPSPAPTSSAGGYEDDDDDDDDDAASTWGSLLGLSSSPAPTPVPAPTPAPVPAPYAPVQPAAGRELTLTAIRYGRLSFTLQAGQRDLPFLLGRSAGYGEFLSQDPRVSNEHCYLAFQGGSWVVIDNHSSNGTAVNKRFLDYNGQQALHDGDELMLGHHPDSMAFRITIR